MYQSVAIDGATAARRVKATLRGPVLEILAERLPEIHALPRGMAFEKVLDDIRLLERCFTVFNTERPRFRHVLVDAQRRPVEDDITPLACGRTLSQIVAMVVRSAAKRYFRRHLGATRTAARVNVAPRARFAPTSNARFAATPKAKPSLFSRLVHWMAEPERTAMVVRRDRSRLSPADELYNAIKDYLLHDWQVPLVPAYADLQPGQVRALGPRLLDCRDRSQLQAALANPSAPVAKPLDAATLERVTREAEALAKGLPASVSGGPRPEPASAMDALLSVDGRRLRAQAFGNILLKPEVRAALNNPDQMVYMSSVLGNVGGHTARALVERLGFDGDRLAVFLVAAQRALGSDVFLRIFGPEAEPALVERLVHQAQLSGIGPEIALADCARFVSRLFGRFQRPNP